ncbi:MAG TPA: nitroreductase family protein [Armatimonadota bacterium]|jgi:nitroreductase
MELLEAIAARRSVRRYQVRPVARETIEGLIRTATLAPSASNVQPWAFGVIEDGGMLSEISDRAKAYLLAALEQTPALEHYRAPLSDPTFDIFYQAPALVGIYATAESAFATGDCSMAAYTLMLAAREQGLGTCWIGFAIAYLNAPEAKASLGVPAAYQAVSALVLGYPDGAYPTPTPRNAPEVVFWREG